MNMSVACPLCEQSFPALEVTAHALEFHVGPVGDVWACGEAGCRFKARELAQMGAHSLVLGHRAVLVKKVECRSAETLAVLRDMQDRLFATTGAYAAPTDNTSRAFGLNPSPLPPPPVPAQSGLDFDDSPLQRFFRPSTTPSSSEPTEPPPDEVLESSTCNPKLEKSSSEESTAAEAEEIEQDEGEESPRPQSPALDETLMSMDEELRMKSPPRAAGKQRSAGKVRHYSVETKLAAVAKVAAGGSKKAVARMFGTCPRNIRAWIEAAPRLRDARRSE